MATIVIHAGPNWHHWDWRSPDTTGVGGSETAAINMARELSLLGHKCKIFAEVAARSIDPQSGTEYLSHQEWDSFAAENRMDVLICSRSLASLVARPKVDRVFAWLHDVVAIYPEQHPWVLEVPERYFVLSKWHFNHVQQKQNLPKNKLFLTSNGVNPNRYLNAAKVEKDRFSAFYSSSPERGLDKLIDALPAIRKHVPDFKLHVCNDSDVAEQWVQSIGNQEQKDALKRVKLKLGNEGVIFHGRVNQSELAKIQMRSGMWLYPTTFSETSCITAMEAGFARCPIVTNPLAALSHTCGGSGIMLAEGTLDEFVEEVVRLCYDNHYYAYWQRMAHEGMQKYTWSAVARQWDALIKA